MALLLAVTCASYGSQSCNTPHGCPIGASQLQRKLPCTETCLFASNGTAEHSHKCEKDDTGWCHFKKASDFDRPWCMYFCEVYGEVPDKFPLSISDSLSMIYDTVADQYDVTRPDKVGTCPRKGAKRGEHYKTNNHYQPEDTSWIWKPPPYDAEKEKKWVEVIHQKDPFGDEKHGCWMLKARGSGIWFNMGKTIAFAEHGDAYSHFGVSAGGDMNVKLAKAAAAKGFDSIQFTAHHDHTNYPCDTDAGVPYMNIEIVGVQLSGASACCAPGLPSPFQTHSFMSGHPPKAARPCVCDTSQEHLNCKYVPSTLEE